MSENLSIDEKDLLSRRLNRDGYLLLLLGMDTQDFYKNFKSKKGVKLDYTHRHKLKVFIEDDEEKKVLNSFYGGKPARMIVASFYAFGLNGSKKMGVEEFKRRVANAFEDYCVEKEGKLKENEMRGLKRLSLNETQIGHRMNRKWFKLLFGVDEKKIKLKYNLKEVVVPKI